MKKLIFAALLAGASFSAAAQAVLDAETVKVPRPTLSIDLPAHARRFSKEDFEPFQAAYDLSNGSSVTLTRSGNRMYAEIDQLGKHEIIGASSNTFVALDRKLQLHVDRDQRDGSVSGELLMVVDQPVVAGMAPAEPKLLLVAFR